MVMRLWLFLCNLSGSTGCRGLRYVVVVARSWIHIGILPGWFWNTDGWPHRCCRVCCHKMQCPRVECGLKSWFKQCKFWWVGFGISALWWLCFFCWVFWGPMGLRTIWIGWLGCPCWRRGVQCLGPKLFLPVWLPTVNPTDPTAGYRLLTSDWWLVTTDEWLMTRDKLLVTSKLARTLTFSLDPPGEVWRG